MSLFWIIVGTVAFGPLCLFEYQKCRSVRKGTSTKNGWFLLGTLLLLLSCAGLAVRSPLARGIRFWAGLLILLAGLVFYTVVLSVVPDLGAYGKDSNKFPVCRKGIYGRMRHPGVWSFLVCATGYGMVFPKAWIPAMWFSFLNLIYTWVQDRYFFPVYLEGYEQYRREVPFLFPRRSN